jgi:predicted ArsR family transcriptional regulator
MDGGSRRSRYFTSTRGRIVGLLRRASRTVNELAAALSLTDNAVRAQLATLERDGLVRQSGSRPGFRKPNSDYSLTPEAEQLFPKPYGPVLNQLLHVFRERMPPGALEAALREAGQRIGRSLPAAAGDRHQRAQHAARVIGDLGGLADVEQRDEGLFLRGYSCPLAAVLPAHPEACRLAEAILSEVVGSPVRECCGRGEPSEVPRCCFKIGSPA